MKKERNHKAYLNFTLSNGRGRKERNKQHFPTNSMQIYVLFDLKLLTKHLIYKRYLLCAYL